MTFFTQLNSAFSVTQQLELLLRIVVACLCGAAIGFERTRRLKEAGLRTHCVVACASALLMIVSKYAFADLSIVNGLDALGTRGADPSRIAAQVVSGIGFLGAGMIFRNGLTLHGLTTAAGIWATAAVGMCIGAGLYFIGLFTALLLVVTQTVLHRLNVGNDAFSTQKLAITLREETALVQAVETLLADKEVLESGIERANGDITYKLIVRSRNPLTFEKADAFMRAHDGIIKFSVH